MDTTGAQDATVGSSAAENPSAQYEFTADQNASIGELASKMRFVGLFLIIAGVLQCALILGRNFIGLIGIVNILIGIWTRSAAGSFQTIVGTEGRDISHLMRALADLLKMYRLQYILLVISLILLAVAVPLIIIFALSGVHH